MNTVSTVIAIYTTKGDTAARLISAGSVSEPRSRPGNSDPVPDPRAFPSLPHSTDGSLWRPV
jgi:hypothetical protein